MIYIIKHNGINNSIVGRLGDVFEYDDEILGEIMKECGREGLMKRLYYPYSISEKENPQFEIYKYRMAI